MDNSRPTTDLQQILANLAQIGNSAQSPTTVYGEHGAGSLQHGGPTEENKRSLRNSNTILQPQSRSIASPQPMIDPATITTWQDGLRCVTKIAAQNAHFSTRIRLMIERQRKQEMKWYQERQALKQVQANRARSTAEAQSILRTLADGKASDLQESKVDQEQELASFDRKLYDSQAALEADMTVELKALGVPFFGTSKELIVADDESTLSATRTTERPKWSPLVTEEQLLALRKRMVEHLEDLYRD